MAKPKIVIIEGPDNTGKGTIIKTLMDKCESVKIIHCGVPQGETNDDKFKHQVFTFNRHALTAILDWQQYPNSEDLLIFDRYHYGEYVYGQMYREGDPHQIREMINAVDRKLLSKICALDIYYIQLLSTSVGLLEANDDNLSLSGGKSALIKKENELFREVFDYSMLPMKKIVYVNQGNEFRNREDIANEVMKFINS